MCPIFPTFPPNYVQMCKGGDPRELMTLLAFKAYILPQTNSFRFAREF